MGRWIDPSWWTQLSYFSFQPVLPNWCNKDHGMCYPVCGMMGIKEPLLLIGKSSLCGGSWFPLSLSDWSFVYVWHQITINKMFWRKEGNVFFNDALNTFYLRLYGIRHMVKDHSHSERENLLPPYGQHWPEREIAQWCKGIFFLMKNVMCRVMVWK